MNGQKTPKYATLEGAGYPKNSAHGRVVHAIGEDIVSGLLKPGEVIPAEADLMARFDVSRNSLREAIKVISGKGLVQAKQRVGVTVRDRQNWNFLDADVLRWQVSGGLTPEFLEKLIEVRQTIEPAAARYAAKRASRVDLARVQRACESMEAHVDAPELFLADDVEFHVAILVASGNPIMSQFAATIRVLLECSFALQHDVVSPDRDFLIADAGVHRRLFELIKANDVTGAEDHMRHIVEQGAVVLFRYVEEQRSE